jgi:hypothetical protein
MNEEAASSEKGSFISRLIWIFVSPKRLFEEIRDGEVHWWQPWVWVSLLNMLTTYVGLPIQTQLASLNPHDLTDEQLQQNLEALDKFGFLGVISTPVVILITGMIIVAISYIVLSVLADQARFKKYLTAYFYASIVASVGLVLGTALTLSKGVENIRSMQDATASFGPALLVSADQKILHSIMSNLDLFDLWFFGLIGASVMTIFNLTKRSAVLVVLPIWLIYVLLTLVTTRLSG